MFIASLLNLKGPTAQTDTTDATSTTTGSLKLAGGLGIVKALWVGGLANIAGTLTGVAAVFTGAITGTSGTWSGTQTVNADLKLGTAGNGIYVKEGTNATMGLATLVAGVVVVSTTKVTANSRIFLTRQTIAGTLGSSVDVTARTAGTSFTITANGSILDTSTVAWLLIEPA